MGFSREMKDFLAAYKTGQSINASRTDQEYKDAQTARTKATTERENDPDTLKTAAEQARANLSLTQSRIANSGAARSATGARTELIREQLRQLREGASGGSGLYPTGAINPTITPGGNPVPATAGALPVGPSTLNTGEDEYADGGLVPDADDDDSEGGGEAVLDTSPTPTLATPASAPTDISARSREPRPPRGLEGVISPQLVADATKQGMTWGVENFGLGKGAVRSPQSMLRAKQLAQGMGGLSEQEMQAARQAVDPKGELSDSQRNMAALGSVYQFWANKGEPEKARRVAFQMLQYYRNATQRYAAIAAKAAEGGNVDLATKAALKAYANVPDGRDIEIMPNPDGGLMYTYTGPNGDLIAKGVATPQQLAASAMGLATGGFDKAILSAAGAMEAPKNKGAVGGRPQSSGDRAKEAETMEGEVMKLRTAYDKDEKNKDKPLDDEFWSQVASGAQHLYQQNPKATPGEVARAAKLLFSPGSKDPEKPDYKIVPGDEDKPSKLKFGNGLSLEVDDSMIDQITNARAMISKRAWDETNKKMEEAEKPGVLSGVGEGAAQVGRGVKKFVDEGGVTGAVGRTAGAVTTKALDALKGIYGQHIPQGVVDAITRAGNVAGGAVSDAAGDIGDIVSFKNRGAIPVDENDRPL